MAASKFTTETTEGLIELVGDGLTIKDAALALEVREKTVRNWLAKGRGEKSGPHFDFARSIEEAQHEAEASEEPMDRDELLLVVSKAARKGSVQAMKLMEEMLRAHQDPGDKKPKDAFEKLDAEDELDAARKAREAA